MRVAKVLYAYDSIFCVFVVTSKGVDGEQVHDRLSYGASKLRLATLYIQQTVA